MMLRLLWWLTAVLLLPLLVLQGRRVRRSTPRLPVAQGQASGVVGPGAPALSLLAIGESPVAGVGVARYEQALAAQLARALRERLQQPVAWRALGENGADAAGVLERLVPQVTERHDAIVLVLGVNDTTGFTPLSRWQRRLRTIVARLRLQCRGPIVLAGVPPLGRFTALPQPLRAWLGLRARILDAAMGEAIVGQSGVFHAAVAPELEAAHLAADGYHPSEAGAAAWAEALAEFLAPRL